MRHVYDLHDLRLRQLVLELVKLLTLNSPVRVKQKTDQKVDNHENLQVGNGREKPLDERAID